MTTAANTENNFQAELEADVAATFNDVFGSEEPAFRPREEAPEGGNPDGEAGGAVTAAPATPPAAPAEQPAAQPPATPESAPATPPVQPPAPLTPPATPPVAATPEAEQALRLASLEATNNALQAELAQLRANPQPATPGSNPQQPSSAAESGEPPLERYNLSLPANIQAALTSDDPNQMLAGIQSLINDLGTIVHNRVLGQARELVTQTVQQAVGGVRQEQALTQQQQEVQTYRNTYYERFPAHNNPLILPLLQAETAKLSAEYPNARFDDNFINSLGSRVNNAISQLSGSGQPQPQVQPSPTVVPPRPAAMLQPGARAQVPGSELEGSDLIEQTLSAF